ncbi:hypothetical protein [Methylovorus glucosotrophus]|uniref:Viral A-type inclusion protein n=1 Tax=Methylovorus glucosotrophus (strain SIP3-4) TaxID=582744 RepID=C6X7W4_METGS|nr:hypothetical protein [Methylovorus glucosotrophus]ACT51291.1 viral A-type inclusion protein [Methylovorus glucosotrophus SIP3-4]
MTLKSYKLSTEIEDNAKVRKMNVHQYVKYLEKLAENNRGELANSHIERLKSLEGIVQSLVQQNISRRANELKLEKEHKEMYESNNKLHELILAKFEFINALEKEFK